MQPCLSEGQDTAPPTRVQVPVPPIRKPTQATGLTSPTGGRHQKQEGKQPQSLQKGDHKHSKLDKIKRQRNKLQTKEQGKNPQDQINEEEIGNLPEKEFNVMTVKMIQNLGNGMEAQIEKVQEILKKYLEEHRTKSKQ